MGIVSFVLSPLFLLSMLLFGISYLFRSLRWAVLSGSAEKIADSHISYNWYVLPMFIAEPLRARKLGGVGVAGFMAWERITDAIGFGIITVFLVGGGIAGIVSGIVAGAFVYMLLYSNYLKFLEFIKPIRTIRKARKVSVVDLFVSLVLAILFWTFQIVASFPIIGSLPKTMVAAMLASMADPLPMGLGAMEGVFALKFGWASAIEKAMEYRLSAIASQFIISFILTLIRKVRGNP